MKTPLDIGVKITSYDFHKKDRDANKIKLLPSIEGNFDGRPMQKSPQKKEPLWDEDFKQKSESKNIINADLSLIMDNSLG